MKATELRIGNLIYSDTKQVTVIDGFMNDSVYKNVDDERVRFILSNITYCNGIPLTEEWILKFGLKRGGYDMIEVWHPDKPRFVMAGYLDDEEDNDYLGWNYNYSGTTEEEYGSSRIYIRYVHQLQNLYFALTGEELTLKP